MGCARAAIFMLCRLASLINTPKIDVQARWGDEINRTSVIPAKAGIQAGRCDRNSMDTNVRRHDD